MSCKKECLRLTEEFDLAVAQVKTPKPASALFTLLLSIAIALTLGLIVFVVVTRILRSTGTLRQPQFATVNRMVDVGCSISSFRHNGLYPKSLEEMVERIEAFEREDKQYLYRYTTDILDGWGNKFAYSSDGYSWTLTSYGADGKPGGQGINADIFSTDKRSHWNRRVMSHRCFRDAMPTYLQTIQADWPSIQYWTLLTVLTTWPLLLAHLFGSKRKSQKEYVKEAGTGIAFVLAIVALLWFLVILLANVLPGD